MSPAQVQSLLNQAVAHHRAGRIAAAEQIYQRLRSVAPGNFDVLHLSGLAAYQAGRIPAAVDLLGRAHAAAPRDHVCAMRFALALLAAGRPAEAEAHFRRAVRLRADFVEGWENLAYCLKAQDRLAEAVACHEKVAALRPDYAPGWYNFGLTLSLAGRSAEALACHDRALAADPNCALGRFGRAQALHQLHRMPEAVADYRRYLAANPRHHEAHSYLLFALHSIGGISRGELFAAHVAYGRSVGQCAARPLPNAPEPGRRLRLAFLSPDLRTHSVAYFLEPLVARLDRTEFEVCLYHDHFREDEVTARLRGLADIWRNFLGRPGDTVEAAIRADAPDILIDLAGHTGMTNRLPLFARRLAPVQVTYLGYPDTTGLPAMDHRFTDAVADPPGEADGFATEQLIRFAPTAWAYAPPAEAPAVQPPPALARGHITFGCFNNPAKITEPMLALWARILQAVPGSRLCLKGSGFGEPAQRARFAAGFARAGVAPDRIDCLERTPDTRSHLAGYHRVDVALDTSPYNGTTTTCEALWMGVPVVALAGDRHMARVSASLLAACGHPEWVAVDEENYVAAAVRLAGDRARLAEIRAGLRDDLRRSALLDHAGQARRFGDALRECWQAWCRRSPRAAPLGAMAAAE
ncbi:MAG: tetratricopeptide repeat protein [Opitutae bacterium]|nr:tetratricopeptide repeat protein [Opitutae bacterium]